MKTILLTSALLLAGCGGTTPEPAAPEPAAPEAPAPDAATTTTEAAAEGTAVADAAPGDAAHGKEIVGSKCTSCHGAEVFTREDRKVQSAEALDAQVDMCGGAAQLSESDKDDVKSYLTSEYYSFE